MIYGTYRITNSFSELFLKLRLNTEKLEKTEMSLKGQAFLSFYSTYSTS